MLETSVDLRSSQAWSQFDDAMTQFGGHSGGAEDAHRGDAVGDDPHTPGAVSDEELSDSGEFRGDMAGVREPTKGCGSLLSMPASALFVGLHQSALQGHSIRLRLRCRTCEAFQRVPL